jgi:hypothetical protein
VPLAANTSFESPTAAGDVLVWAENAGGGQQLWTVDLRAGRAAHLLTADAGDTRFYQSQYDLVIAQGRVHWVAAAPQSSTEVRSVALTGGPVEINPDASSVAYRAGVLWWSTGSQDSFLRHAVDLRTV